MCSNYNKTAKICHNGILILNVKSVANNDVQFVRSKLYADKLTVA